MIYLDNAATTKPKEEVLNTVINSLKEDWYNPSSQYLPSQDVHVKMSNARATIANKIHCSNNELYFTSSGSESNSMALSCLEANCHFIYIDPCSHASILNSLYATYLLDVDNNGKIDIELLEKELMEFFENDLSIAVSINGANNEIGTIQDIKAIADIVHSYDGILHVDAVQLFGNQEIDVNDLGIDLLSISAHKIGCFSSIAALYVRKGLFIPPIIYGEQEQGKRGGTENIPYILGFAKAVELLDYSKVHEIEVMRNYFIDKLNRIPGSYLVGTIKNRLANNINFCFRGVDASAIINYLDIHDIYCSGGSACNSFSLEPSKVLQAIKLKNEDLHSCVRFSIGEDTTYDDIDKVSAILSTYLSNLRKLAEENSIGGDKI